MTDYNRQEWIKANTHRAHQIINEITNTEEKDVLENTLGWCEREIEQSHKIIEWYESAVKEVCNKKQYQKILSLYMVFMNNDFIQNSSLGREMYEKGQINATSSKFIIYPDKFE